jgi:hypothetical protein
MKLNKIHTELQELSITQSKEIEGGNIASDIGYWTGRLFGWPYPSKCS